jgi:hypothetical protein
MSPEEKEMSDKMADKKFQEQVETTLELLKGKHDRVSVKKLQDNLALLIGKDYDARHVDPHSGSRFDIAISKINFYLLEQGKEGLREFYKDAEV